MRAAELNGKGVSPGALRRKVRDGSLVRVRHGAYVGEPDADAAVRHRELLAGTWPLLGDNAVLSHGTAAVLHGLPLWEGMLERVSFTRPVGGHGRSTASLRVRLEPLADRDLASIDGYPLTSLERTALDLARTLTYERAVALLDAALHAGADRRVLEAMATESRGRAGIGTARAALEFSDGRAESVAESISRVRMVLAGLPAPELQVDVYDADGNWIGRSDFGWLDRGVLGEFDGRIKYTGTPEEVALAVMQEKRREDSLRELGWVVVRWGYAELQRGILRRRIAAAFDQARPGTIVGHATPRPRI